MKSKSECSFFLNTSKVISSETTKAVYMNENKFVNILIERELNYKTKACTFLGVFTVVTDIKN